MVWSAAPSPGDYNYTLTPSGSSSEVSLWGEDGTKAAAIVDGATTLVASESSPAVESYDDLGARRWRVRLGTAADDLSPLAQRGDGSVVVGTRSGDVVVLAGADGAEIWRTAVGAGISFSPALAPDDGVVVVSEGGEVVSLDPQGGERWRYPLGTPAGAAPSVAGDGVVYAPGLDGVLRVLAADGSLVVAASLGGPNVAALSTAAVASDGWTFLGRDDGRLLGLASAVSRGRPPDVGNSLRAWKDGPDVAFAWVGNAASCSYNLRKGSDPATPATAALAAHVPPDAPRDIGDVPSPSPLYYRLYGLECCAGLQGP